MKRPSKDGIAKRGRGGIGGSLPHPVDIHVGSRIRLRRTLLGMSQEQLGAALGLTFQQIQKYERGANRVSASRLHYIAQTLDVPVSFFFDDMPETIVSAPVSSRVAFDSTAEQNLGELARYYCRIQGRRARRLVIQLARELAGPQIEDRLKVSEN